MLAIEIVFYFSSLYVFTKCIYRSLVIHGINKKNQPNKALVGFSVIICAHNEQENLKKNIPLILSQKHGSFELIVVLDRCNDGSFDYLASVFKQDERLSVITINKVPDDFHPKKFGLKNAIAHAKYDWILLTDADCRPSTTNWIKSYNDRIRPEMDIILGVSPYEYQKGFLNQLINYETFQTAHSYLSYAATGRCYMGVGRNMAYRKSTFIGADGFTPFQGITGGDDDLLVQKIANKSNVALNIDSDGHMISWPKTSWRDYFVQKTRHLSVGKYYDNYIKLTLGIQATAALAMWLSFIILISFNTDMEFIGLIFAMTIALSGLLSGYLASKLGFRYKFWRFPMLDFVYTVLLPIVSIQSLLIKKVKWN